MWLLSTNRAELHFFPSPEDVEDGYAALSHVWDTNEQSYHDVREIQKTCNRDGTNPRDFMRTKIRMCCLLAESHGYKWVWIDTCCIDKTSSSELSEAINAMYRYYAVARICYGYLRDILFLSGLREGCEADVQLFVQSIWFQRGWTLQELIAPRFVLFLSSQWEVLGTKSDLATLLEWELGIPASVLRLEVSHAVFSIAERMSWFGRRKTTRIEDEAYCLLGLFDIHMPPLYGEGRNAFRRLQKKIMKQSSDTTLFAWDDELLDDHTQSCLFAPSPSAFTYSNIVYSPPWRAQAQASLTYNNSNLEPLTGTVNEIAFSVTPHGILACIPIVTCGGKIYADLYWRDGRSCGLLCLEEDPNSQAGSSRHPLYRVCSPRILRTRRPTATGRYDILGQTGHVSWREVLIRPAPSPHDRGQPGQLSDSRLTFIPAMPRQLALDAPYRFDETSIRRFLRNSRADRLEVRNAELQAADSHLPTTYTFVDGLEGVFIIVIKIGQCHHSHSEGSSGHQPGPALVWATAGCVSPRLWPPTEDELKEFSNDPSHNCLEDHVLRWPALQKRVDLDAEFGVTLSFKPCPINPGRTLVLDASYQWRRLGRLMPSARHEGIDCHDGFLLLAAADTQSTHRTVGDVS